MTEVVGFLHENQDIYIYPSADATRFSLIPVFLHSFMNYRTLKSIYVFLVLLLPNYFHFLWLWNKRYLH